MSAASSAARFRAGAVGATGAALALAAHGFGGDGRPDLSALTLLVGLGVAISAATVRAAGRPGTAAALIGSQLGGHVVLAAAGGHAHPLHIPPAMVSAHLIAAVACGLLIVAAEQVYAALVRVSHIVTTTPHAPASEPRLSIAERPFHVGSTAGRGGISVRGPPARSCGGFSAPRTEPAS
ncbi:hypothetical protein [Skermania piniformis]|uniref:HPP family protein n=1 Tax=Skermania pinensis TaxID=39122 RepID=A0ABX8S801_9ACTN|nr:hypothetical protein [Skermania piniformis]QXQ13975.1 hypothetical protein KV203_00420 [Skermania piniformis]